MKVCPNCEGKVTPEDKVCPVCKTPLVGKERKPMKGRNIALILGVVLVIAAIVICVVPLKTVSYTVIERYQATETYYVSEPYTVQEPYAVREAYTVTEEYTTTQNKSRTLYDNISFGVSPGYYKTYSTYIDIDGKTGNFVSGNVKALAGGEFLFYVFDQKNYNAWRNYQSYQPYVAPGRVSNYSFLFVPDHTDYYYFVFSNTFSWFTNKLIQFRAEWDCQETITETREVTKYRDVTKYREVTKYRDVPKERTVWRERSAIRFKKVSLLEYLISY